jgi:hypothetical protein
VINLRVWAGRMNIRHKESFEGYLRGTSTFAECAIELIEELSHEVKKRVEDQTDAEAACEEGHEEQFEELSDKIKKIEQAARDGFDVERLLLDK